MSLEVLYWVTTAVGATLNPILILYGVYKLKQAGDAQRKRHVQVRSPGLVKKFCFTCIFHCVIERPFITVYQLGYLSHMKALEIVYIVLPCLPLVCFFGFLRVWILYWNNEIENRKQKASVSSGRRSVSAMSFSKHAYQFDEGRALAHAYVNENYMTKVLVIPTCIFYMCGYVFLFLVVDNTTASNLLLVGSLFFPLILALMLLHTVDESVDIFHQKTELLICTVVLIMQVLVLFLLAVLVTNEIVLSIIMAIMVNMGIGFVCWFQTMGVLYLFPDHSDMNDLECPKTQEGINNAMYRILGNQQGFSAFLDHLKREFSSENLLFFVEACKYKRILAKDTKEDIKDKYKQLKFDWVEQPEDFKEFFHHMYASHIYDKYVACTHNQINLPCHVINGIKKSFQEPKKEQLPLLFDEALDEMWLLMQDAFRRFERTPEYNGPRVEGFAGKRGRKPQHPVAVLPKMNEEEVCWSPNRKMY